MIRYLSLVSLVLCGCLTGGCSEPSPRDDTAKTPKTRDTRAPAAHHRPSTPLVSKLLVPPGGATSNAAEIGVRIERKLSAVGAVSVELRVPNGVTVSGAATKSRVTFSAGNTIALNWKLSYKQVPTTDATVVVDWQTKTGGYHAALPYRFGRKAPRNPQQKKLPSAPTLPGGGRLGKPVVTD